MKKFWNLMLAALVIFGAVACTENQEENIPEAKKEPVLSFVANIANDETRVDVQNTDGVWTTVWEENETLIVYCKDAEYEFTNADSEDKSVFTCYDDDVLNCVGEYVQIDNGYLDSKAGTKGSWIWAEIYPFDPTAEITLVAQTSFFKFTSAHEVTLSASDKIFEVEGEGSVNSVTFAAGEDIMVAFLPPTGDEVTFSYSIDGVKCKEIKDKQFEAKKVYNLGELNDKVVLLESNMWYTGENNEWFAAHFWNSSSSKFEDVTLSKVRDGIYGCVVPADMTHVIFCRMNNKYTDFSWEGDHVWNKTQDLTIGVAPTNYCYIADWGNGRWRGLVVDPKPDTVSVYLTTTWDGWGTFKLYGFGGTNASWGTFNNWNNCPSSSNQVIDGVTYKSWDIPASCIGKSGTTIIVRGTAGKQTADYPITFEAGKDVFITLEWKEEKNGSITEITSPYTK